MRYCRETIHLVLAVVAAALLSTIVGAAQQVPFKARISVASTFDVQTGFEDSLGLAHATHLGRASAHLQHIVGPNIEVLDGRFIMTAANGDQVCGSYVGQGTPVQFEPLLIDFEGTFIIEGGTGRFAGATGAGTIFGLVDPFPDVGVPTGTTADLTLDGTISRARGGSGDSDETCPVILTEPAP